MCRPAEARCRARCVATSPSCASAVCSAATSPRRRPTAASTRRSRVAGRARRRSRRLGWDAVIAGPGPGIIGSDTRLGHGGIAALDTAHASLALGLPDPALPAPLQRRPPRAPPPREPPHADRDAAAAGWGRGRRPVQRAGARSRSWPRQQAGATASTKHRRTSTATRLPACRRGRWAAASRRTHSSSRRRSLARVACLARARD